MTGTRERSNAMLISKVNRFTLILLGLLVLVPGGAALQAAEREPLRVLVVRGLWHEQYRLDEALAAPASQRPTTAGCGIRPDRAGRGRAIRAAAD